MLGFVKFFLKGRTLDSVTRPNQPIQDGVGGLTAYGSFCLGEARVPGQGGGREGGREGVRWEGGRGRA